MNALSVAWRRLAFALAFVCVSLTTPAWAVELSEFDGPEVRRNPLDNVAIVAEKCRNVAYFKANADNLKACHAVEPADFEARKSAFTKEAEAWVAFANEYLWALDSVEVGACKPVAPSGVTTLNDAVGKAQKELADAEATLNAAATPKDVEAATKDVAAKRADLNAVFKSAVATKVGGLFNGMVAKFDAAMIAAEPVRDVRSFEKIAEDAITQRAADDKSVSRADSCLAAYTSRIGAGKKADEAAADAAKEQAHEEDTLRKTSSGPTLSTLANAAVEQPGSPDYIVYSILAALGGEEETNGTQLSVTLNLSSLIWPKAKDRLAQSVGVRNLFLRGMFPLDVTEGTPAPTQDPVVTDRLRRFSAVLGGSFIDENDTRLDANRRCYEAALAYAGFAPTVAADDPRLVERQAYFDVCNHLVVNRARLAWRVGAGFLSDQDKPKASVKPEMYAGVLVWAPSSQLYANLLYQQFRRPRIMHVGGIGISAAGNAGGNISGTNAWARVGLDTTFVLGHDPDAKETSWELKLAPSIRGRMFGDGVTSLDIGPRFFSHGPPQLLASVTFGYDADRIMSQLLTPMPEKP